MRPLKMMLLPLLLVLLVSPALADPCVWPPPTYWPGGIVELPPTCDPSYSGMFYIVAKPGYALSGPGAMRDVVLHVDPRTVPSECEIFTGEIFVRVGGFGSLEGFDRDIAIPVTGEFHFDPQTPGDPIRNLSCSLYSLEGQLTGDPDFCDLIITAGEEHGLPSPGSTTLTELPDGTFNVDSFFDITYEIEFTGCPGSILEGMTEFSVFTECWRTGEPFVPVIDHNCQLPDNGAGTIDLPPACPDGYVGELTVTDGLPPGTTISGPAILRDISVTTEGPGGTLGGEYQIFEAALYWDAVGTGEMTGFFRTIYIPVSCVAHTGPRNPGDPVQTFGSDLVFLQGQVFGDPDFCDLIITAGQDSGLPSPGSTTLTELPTGDFAVDSFFDITYEIEFTGCPGSILEGLSGMTRDTKNFHAGEPYLVSGVDDLPASPFVVLHQNTPNPFNPVTTIRYSLSSVGRMSLTVYNVRGQKVVTLDEGHREAGTYEVHFDATHLASGTYFYRLTTGNFTQTRKMLLLK